MGMFSPDPLHLASALHALGSLHFTPMGGLSSRPSGGSSGAPSGTTSTADTPKVDEFAQAQQMVKALKERDLTNPSADVISRLSQTVGDLSPEQAAQVQKLLGTSTVATDLSKALAGQDPQAIVSGAQQGGGNDLANVLGAYYQQTVVPFLQQTEKTTAPMEDHLIAALKSAIGGAGPAYKSAMAGVPEAFAAANKLEQGAVAQQAATAPAWAGMLQMLAQQRAAYNAQQQAAYNQQYAAGGVPGMGVNPYGLPLPAGH